MLYELRVDEGNAVCGIGISEHPWPPRGGTAYEVGESAHLILLDAHTVCGLKMWGLPEIDGIEAAMNRSGGRILLRIYGLGDEWTYELFPAYA